MATEQPEPTQHARILQRIADHRAHIAAARKRAHHAHHVVEAQRQSTAAKANTEPRQ